MMNSNQSLRSNTNITGRASPNFQTPKSDNLATRTSNPSLNNRLSVLRQQESNRSESPTKNFNDDDIKYHKIVFERCTDPPGRGLITDREKFAQALNYVGFDLPKTSIDQLWSNNHEEVTFKLFQRILNDEKSIDERTLDDAFETLYNKEKKSDWSAIDFNRFRTDMLEKGDRLTEGEFEKLRRALGTTSGKVDVKKLTKTIGETKTNCRQKLLAEKEEERRGEIDRITARPNSPKPNKNNNNDNNVQIHINGSSNKLDIPQKLRSVQRKGAFFCEYFDLPTDATYLSIGYSFELKRDTDIWITLEPNVTSRYHTDTLFKNLDVRLLLFQRVPRSTERRLIHISSARSGTKSYLQLDELQRGSYEIIPFTFGGVLRPRSREVNERAPIKTLRETKKGKHFAMTTDYREALEFIFDVFDFDDNKYLDRNEYNLWTLRTAREEITDEDWNSIRDTVKLDDDDKISKDQFLKLNDFEVQEPETTEKDLWTGLKSVGFNYALELDMMCPFKLTAHTNEPSLQLAPTDFVQLAEIKQTLTGFLQKKGEKIRMNNSTVQCFNYQDDYGSILFVENKGEHNARISVQVTTSVNTALTLPIDTRKPPVINVRHDASQIIWFAHKLDSQRAMELDATVQVL